jgi:hypothetical protein
MAKHVLDRQAYEKLGQAFAEKGKNYQQVAVMCGVDERTAKKAWLTGWPKRNWPPFSTSQGLPITGDPLKKVTQVVGGVVSSASAAKAAVKTASKQATAEIQATLTQAKADMEASRQRALELERQARAMAEKVHGDELGIAAGTRGLVKMQIQPLILCLRSCQGAYGTLEKHIAQMAQDPNSSPERLVEFLAALLKLSKMLADLARVSFELERMANGEPTEILKLKTEVDVLSQMTPEQALEEIDAANRSAMRARELGLVSVHAGGEPMPPEVAPQPAQPAAPDPTASTALALQDVLTPPAAPVPAGQQVVEVRP